MLTSLLPGFRQIRAPIAAGTLIVASLYMIVASGLDEAAQRDDLGRGLSHLDDQIGQRGWLAAATVVAYLIGSIYVSFVSWTWRRVNRHLARSRLGFSSNRSRMSQVFLPLTEGSIFRLQKMVRRENLADSDDGGIEDHDLTVRIASDVLFDRGERLLVANKELHAAYDRLRSEAEFRDSVWLPGLVTTFVILNNLEVGFWAAALIVVAAVGVSVALVLQARAQERGAMSMYAHAVADGVVATKTLDEQRARRTQSSE